MNKLDSNYKVMKSNSLILFMLFALLRTGFASDLCAMQFQQDDYNYFLVRTTQLLVANSQYSNDPRQGEKANRILNLLSSKILDDSFVKSNWAHYSNPLTRHAKMQALLMSLKPRMSELQNISDGFSKNLISGAIDFDSILKIEAVFQKIDSSYTEGIIDFSRLKARSAKISVADPSYAAKRIREMSAQERREKEISDYIEGIDPISKAPPKLDDNDFSVSSSGPFLNRIQAQKPLTTNPSNVSASVSNPQVNTAIHVSQKMQIDLQSLMFYIGNFQGQTFFQNVSALFISSSIDVNPPATKFNGQNVLVAAQFHNSFDFLLDLSTAKIPTSGVQDLVEVMLKSIELTIKDSINNPGFSDQDARQIFTNLSYLLFHTNSLQNFNSSLLNTKKLNEDTLASVLYSAYLDFKVFLNVGPHSSASHQRLATMFAKQIISIDNLQIFALNYSANAILELINQVRALNKQNNIQNTTQSTGVASAAKTVSSRISFTDLSLYVVPAVGHMPGNVRQVSVSTNFLNQNLNVNPVSSSLPAAHLIFKKNNFSSPADLLTKLSSGQIPTSSADNIVDIMLESLDLSLKVRKGFSNLSQIESDIADLVYLLFQTNTIFAFNHIRKLTGLIPITEDDLASALYAAHEDYYNLANVHNMRFVHTKANLLGGRDVKKDSFITFLNHYGSFATSELVQRAQATNW